MHIPTGRGKLISMPIAPAMFFNVFLFNFFMVLVLKSHCFNKAHTCYSIDEQIKGNYHFMRSIQ